MKTNLILFSLLLVVSSGCSIFGGPKVPSTNISFNPKTEALHVSSPKDVTIGSVNISQSNGVFTMSVINYSSTNNAALVGVVSSAQAQVASNAAVTINNLANLATTALGKAP